MEKVIKNAVIDASVLVVGAGGLGSVLLYCLCGMGVRRLRIADGDVVSQSNLDRQFLYRYADVGKSKALTARETLIGLRPDAQVDVASKPLTAENADALLSGVDVAVAAVDTMEARRVLNAACVRCGIPLVNGGVSGRYGTVQVVYPWQTACLACVYDDRTLPPEPSPPPVVSTVSALMADAVAAVLSGDGERLSGALHVFDGTQWTLTKIPVAKRETCRICGTDAR